MRKAYTYNGLTYFIASDFGDEVAIHPEGLDNEDAIIANKADLREIPAGTPENHGMGLDATCLHCKNESSNDPAANDFVRPIDKHGELFRCHDCGELFILVMAEVH